MAKHKLDLILDEHEAREYDRACRIAAAKDAVVEAAKAWADCNDHTADQCCEQLEAAVDALARVEREK